MRWQTSYPKPDILLAHKLRMIFKKKSKQEHLIGAN